MHFFQEISVFDENIRPVVCGFLKAPEHEMDPNNAGNQNAFSHEQQIQHIKKNTRIFMQGSFQKPTSHYFSQNGKSIFGSMKNIDFGQNGLFMA